MRSSVAVGSLIATILWFAAPLHAQSRWCREVSGSTDEVLPPTWIMRAGSGDLWWLPLAYVSAEADFVAWPLDPERVPEERPAEGLVDVDTVAVDDVHLRLRVPDVEPGTWLLGTVDGDYVNRATVLAAPAAEAGWSTPPEPTVLEVRSDVEFGVAGCVGPQIITRHEVASVRLTFDPADAFRLAIDVWNLADGEVVPADGSRRAFATDSIGGRASTSRPIELRTAQPGDRVLHVRTVDLPTGVFSDIVAIPVHVAPPTVIGGSWFPIFESPLCRCTAGGATTPTGALATLVLFGVGLATARRRSRRR